MNYEDIRKECSNRLNNVNGRIKGDRKGGKEQIEGEKEIINNQCAKLNVQEVP
jgi:hypothetical protein